MRQNVIVDIHGLVHGTKQGFTKSRVPKFGTVSWCGRSLTDFVNSREGEYSSIEHQAMGYDAARFVTCIECIVTGE